MPNYGWTLTEELVDDRMFCGLQFVLSNVCMHFIRIFKIAFEPFMPIKSDKGTQRICF